MCTLVSVCVHACVTVSFYHKPPHPLFLNALILFLLLPLSVSVVGGHGFGQFLHFACDRAMVLLEVFGVLQDAVEVLLRLECSTGEGQMSQNTAESTTFNLIAGNDCPLPDVSVYVCALAQSSAVSPASQ